MTLTSRWHKIKTHQMIGPIRNSRVGRHVRLMGGKFRGFSRRTQYALMAVFVIGTMLPIVIGTQHVSASTMGPNSPVTGTATGTVSGCTGSSWTAASQGNITTQDSVYVTTSAALSSGTCTTNYIEATNYGFTIPSTATINGASVTIWRTGTQGSKNVIEDKQISLIVSGSVAGNNYLTSTAWPTTNASANYGGTSDTWGNSLTPTIVNASNFGVAIAAQNVHTSSGSSASETPSVDFASITITYTVPTTYNQAAYRWMQNSNTPTQQYLISEHISSGSDGADESAIDSTGGYIYTVGNDSLPGSNNLEWRIEKRSWSTGVAVPSFGISGVVTENVSSTTNDTALGIAIDTTGGQMYLFGYDTNTSGSVDEWRLEKRSLSTGALDGTFGSGTGAISESIGTASARPNGIAIDPSGGNMYVVGFDNSPGHSEWRLEKRSLSTGALDGTFGSGTGIVTESPSTVNSVANGIAIDPSGGNMYVVGSEGISSLQTEWRLEKRSLSTGALDGTFGSGTGIITDHISLHVDIANGIAIDPSGGNMYVVGYDENTSSTTHAEWRIEKRSLSSGNLDGTFGSGTGGISESISSSADEAISIALDTVGGNMYVAGYDENTTSNLQEWRIEKRSLSSGNLDGTFGSGTGGISEHISSNNDQASSVAIDASSGNMYITGSDQGPGSNIWEWRLEARGLTSGNPMSLSTPTPLAAANTAITTPAGAFRLRLLIGIGSSTLAANGQTFQLKEAQLTSGTCATQTYTNAVTTTSPIAFFTNTNISDGSNISTSSNDPTDGTNTNIAETYVSSSTAFTNSQNAINTGQDGEWDISLYNYSASAGSTYCFEVQKNGGTPLDTYTQYPQLTTSSTSYTQAGYRWFQNNNNTPTSYPISEHSSTANDAAKAVAVDHASDRMYIVGYDEIPSGYSEWRIEKRTLSTGALDSTFGTSGIIHEHISSFNDIPSAIAIDPTGGSMYVVGYDEGVTGGYQEWRIEKRSLSTGALDTTFNSTGYIDESMGSNNAAAASIAIDSTNMYVVGFDDQPLSDEWRIEKRSLSTGALVTSFNTTGYIQESISSSGDDANSIAIDASSMYIAGASNGQIRIEKRSLSSGAFVTAFNSSGFIQESQTGGTNIAWSVAIDSSGGSMYIAGFNGAGINHEWYMEKRSLTSGAFDSTFGSGTGTVSEHISTAYDIAQSVAIDPTGGSMYVVGYDAGGSGGSYEWRIEKRSMSTGNFDSTFGSGTGAISEHISNSSDEAAYVALDISGGNMIVVGYDANTTGNNDEWRIESRLMSSGNTNSGSSPVALLPLDTSTNQFHPGDIVRLRILIGVGGAMIASSGQVFKLQEANSNGSCSNSLSYNDVTSSSGAVRFYTGNTNLTDGSVISTSSNDPTDGYNTVVGQDYLASNTNFTNNQTVLRPTQDGEWDIALQVAATNIGGYCFRVVTSTGSLLDNYNYFPSLGVHALPNQRLHMGKQVVTGIESGLDILIP